MPRHTVSMEPVHNEFDGQRGARLGSGLCTMGFTWAPRTASQTLPLSCRDLRAFGLPCTMLDKDRWYHLARPLAPVPARVAFVVPYRCTPLGTAQGQPKNSTGRGFLGIGGRCCYSSCPEPSTRSDTVFSTSNSTTLSFGKDHVVRLIG